MICPAGYTHWGNSPMAVLGNWWLSDWIWGLFHRREFHACYYNKCTKAHGNVVIGPRIEPTLVILQNVHVSKLPSKYLCLHRGPWLLSVMATEFLFAVGGSHCREGEWVPVRTGGVSSPKWVIRKAVRCKLLELSCGLPSRTRTSFGYMYKINPSEILA